MARQMISNQILRLSCESTRMRMEESLPNHHEDHIAGKGDKFTATLLFGTQMYYYASSHEDTRSNSSSG